MDTHTQYLAAQDLLDMPDNSMRHELVGGTLKTMTLAGFWHGRVATCTASSPDHFVQAQELGIVLAGGTGFKIATDPDTVRAPDVAFVRQERVDAVGRIDGYWPGAPDLSVEVTSPGDRYTEVEEKVFDWLEAGTQLVIVINPRKHTATVYHALDDIAVLTEADMLSGDPVVPGWTMPVRTVFE